MRRLLFSLATACLSALALSACADQNDRLVAPPTAALHGPTGGGGGGQLPPPLTFAVDITAGGYFTCTRLGDSRVFCWGRNEYGQLGTGPVFDNCANGWPCSFLPRQVTATGFTTASQIDAGEEHACAIQTRTGQPWCWGRNNYGQVGEYFSVTGEKVMTPRLVHSGQAVFQISAGGYTTCSLAGSATRIACYGLGFAEVPLLIPGAGPGTSFSQVSVGESHICAITFNGTVNDTYCFGNNFGGKAGAKTTTPSVSPYGTTQFVDAGVVSAGASITCITKRTTTGVECIGDNNSLPSLGSPGFTGRETNIPQPLGTGQQFIKVVAGTDHACALDASLNAWCWGRNYSGQLGNGTNTDSRTPVMVAGGRMFRALALGRMHTCGITDDFAVYCWGDNGDGQLGQGPTGTIFGSPVPLPVAAQW